jgi:mannose-6-phosphate isomerase-like protein (cupin superfamily)
MGRVDDADSILRRLLTGTGRATRSPGVTPVCTLATTKLVRKHWGTERWLVPEGAPFGFKLIHILAGSRTSLHLHRRKEEAFLVLAGEATLWLAGSPDAPPVATPLAAGDVVHLRAGMVHRLAAVRETTLLEVSTSHLDDVVRIEDDRSRGDGRIDAEHE